jgi:hypothetical protein
MWFFNTLGNANGSPRFVKVNPQGKAITCGNPTEPGCHRLFFDVNIAGSGGTTFLEYCPLKLGTQFADAVARAEYQGAPDDWLGKAGMPQMIKSRLQMLPAIG